MASRPSPRLSALNTNRGNYNSRPTAASNNDDFMTLLNVTRSGAFKRLEEDYRNLTTDYEALQVEYSRVTDLNLDYTRIISALSGLMTNQRGEPPAMQQQQEDFESLYNSTRDELEQKTRQYEVDIKQLKSDVTDLEQRLTEKQKELDLASQRKRKIFAKLGLPENSPFEEVERTIEELIRHSYNDENSRQLANDASRILLTNISIIEEVAHIEREKKTLEFQLRQKDISLKRLTNQRYYRPVLNRVHSVISRTRQSLGLPVVDFDDPRNPRKPRNPVGRRTERETWVTNYCVLCGEDCNCHSLTNKCHIHYLKLRGQRWPCCGGDSNATGCLPIPHLYIEKALNSDSFVLTDGIQFLIFTIPR